MPEESSLHKYRITPARRAEHAPIVARMVSEEFAGGEHIAEITRKYFLECHYDWDVARLIWDGDQLVHHWGVWGYETRLAGVTLRTAGVGAVVTRESHRKQGLMRQAALDSFQAMRESGYHLSVLRGRHYARFGYVRAWNYITYKLKADEIRAGEPRAPYQQLGPEFMPQINDLYNRSHEIFSGTAVRPTYSMLDADDMQVFGWMDRGGALDGYVRAAVVQDASELQCLEAVGDPLQCLAVLEKRVREAGMDSLSFFTLPYAHPLLQKLRAGAVLVEERYFDRSGWRVRTVDLRRALETLHPVLEARLADSRFAGWQGSLTVEGGEEHVTLDLDRGRIGFSDLASGEHRLHAGPAIARLLIGSDAPGEVLREAGAVCEGEAAGLAAALFPALHPVLSHWDEY